MKKIMKIMMVILLLSATVFLTNNKVRAEGDEEEPIEVIEEEIPAEEEIIEAEAVSEEAAEAQLPEEAAEAQDTKAGSIAYAILTEDGDLIFFKSNSTYQNETEYNVTIAGRSHKGIVFTGVETNETSSPSWIKYNSKIIKAYAADTIKPLCMTSWFSDAYNMKSFDGSKIDTSSVKNMISTFQSCWALTSLDLSNFNTTSVKKLESMFYDCKSLSYLKLGRDFINASVTNADRIFALCSSLTAIDTSDFITTGLKSFSYMFYQCSSLTSLNLSSFDSSKVTNMSSMFAGCSKLTQIKLGTKWTKWRSGTGFPSGYWIHDSLVLTEEELRSQYPDNASKWYGWWYKATDDDTVRIIPIEPFTMDQHPTAKLTNPNIKVSWSSSDPQTISIDSSGKLTAHKTGTAKITAKSSNGKTDTITVRVLFSDVTDPKLSYYDYVYDLADKGVVGGWADGTFRPNNGSHRAAIMTFLWRLEGKPAASGSSGFSDMTGNEEFDAAITWGVSKGITTGWADNTFRPWNNCNRASIITFIWRAAGRPAPSKIYDLADKTNNADFDKAISWAIEKGICDDVTNNRFRPWDDCLRKTTVTFLARYAALYK